MDVPAVFMRDEDVKCQVGCQWLEGIRRACSGNRIYIHGSDAMRLGIVALILALEL